MNSQTVLTIAQQALQMKIIYAARGHTPLQSPIRGSAL